MNEATVVPLRQPEEIIDPLTEVLRSGAHRLIVQSVEAEFEAFLTRIGICAKSGWPPNSVAEAAIDVFAVKYAPKYRNAVDCLINDPRELLTFYDFPADHWAHLRTSSPIESVFATVRHRTRASERVKPVAEGCSWRHLTRRRRSRNPGPVRRLIPAITHNPAYLLQQVAPPARSIGK